MLARKEHGPKCPKARETTLSTLVPALGVFGHRQFYPLILFMALLF